MESKSYWYKDHHHNITKLYNNGYIQRKRGLIIATLKKIKGHYLVSDLNLSNVTLAELDLGEEIEVNIEQVDKRLISDNQRKLIFALCNDIENYVGDDSEFVRYTAMAHCKVLTLTACSVSQATKIIKELIDFCFLRNIPFSKKTINNKDFKLEQYQIYMLCMTRRCAICGKYHSHIHHVTSVGIGRNREKISHLGMLILPLCFEHHTEAHTIGDKAFIDKYHLIPVEVDVRLEKLIKKGKIEIYKEDAEWIYYK